METIKIKSLDGAVYELPMSYSLDETLAALRDGKYTGVLALKLNLGELVAITSYIETPVRDIEKEESTNAELIYALAEKLGVDLT
jgi:hypothetical protein